MSDDLTQGLPRSFEERVLSGLSAMRQELATVNSRLSALEEKVDARMRETRPIWEGVLTRLDGIESELARMNRQFRSFVADIFEVRVRVEKLEEDKGKQTA
jgi:vacuolar-type H+-ATPase subunit D/Vma8